MKPRPFRGKSQYEVDCLCGELVVIKWGEKSKICEKCGRELRVAVGAVRREGIEHKD